MLIYSILKRQKLLHQNKSDISLQIREICLFMTTKFKPFETLISCEKVPKAKPDEGLHLNIEDPESGELLKTSAFQIDRIIR